MDWKQLLLRVFMPVQPPPVVLPLVDPLAGEAQTVTAPVSAPAAKILADWQRNCPGPFRTGKPCSEVSCVYKMSPGAGEEACLYVHELRSRVGTVDPDETVRIVSEYLAVLVPEIRAARESMVVVGNAIQRALAPLWVKAMLVIWGLATSAQVLGWISMVVGSL